MLLSTNSPQNASWIQTLGGTQANPKDGGAGRSNTKPALGGGCCLAHRTTLRVVPFIYDEISILGDVSRRALWHPISVVVQGQGPNQEERKS